jgi:rubrerythrin|tara:strand:- start:2001 stop:2171 length:171 start_codon:yes stop_codon:yes gene_type:complete
MAKTENPHFVEFEKVLDKLKKDGKISDEKPPEEPEKKRSYIERLTTLFKKEIHNKN